MPEVEAKEQEAHEAGKFLCLNSCLLPHSKIIRNHVAGEKIMSRLQQHITIP